MRLTASLDDPPDVHPPVQQTALLRRDGINMLRLGEILHLAATRNKQTFWHSDSFSITSDPASP